MDEKFWISFFVDQKRYRFLVERLPSDESFDYYKVNGRNGSMVLRNNQPVLRKHRLRYRRPEWKVMSGEVWNSYFKEKLIAAIEEKVL